jgi:hypothetical protein
MSEAFGCSYVSGYGPKTLPPLHSRDLMRTEIIRNGCSGTTADVQEQETAKHQYPPRSPVFAHVRLALSYHSLTAKTGVRVP